METKLQDLYMQMIKESAEGTVNTKIKAGDGYEGSDKAQGSAIQSPDPTEAEGVKQKKPVEGPSADTQDGKLKPLGKKEAKVKEAAADEKPLMTFDQLYTQTINEEEDIISAPDIEGDEFNTEEGDFGGGEEDPSLEGEEGEEIDIASELRMLADRLTEIADKISVEGPVEDEAGLEDGDMGAEADGLGLEDEGLQTEAIVSEPTPKPLKKTTLGPKMKQNPKNTIGKSGAKKAVTPAAGKDRTGKLSPAPKSQFGPNMKQNPNGNGPAVKGSN